MVFCISSLIAILAFYGAYKKSHRCKRRSMRSMRSNKSARFMRSASYSNGNQKERERREKEKAKAQQAAEKKALLEKKEAEKAAKLQVKKELASSDLEYFPHRLSQIYDLIEILEEKQEGTLYGGKEWMKYEKQIMSYESQAQILKKRERQARALVRPVE